MARPKPFPFTPLPNREGVLSLLPKFANPPIILFPTRSYWVAIGDDAKHLSKALNLPLFVDQSLQNGSLYWVAFERVKIDPTRFNALDPRWRGLPMILILN